MAPRVSFLKVDDKAAAMLGISLGISPDLGVLTISAKYQLLFGMRPRFRA